MLTGDFGFHRILKKHPSSESAYDIEMTFIPWLFRGLGKYLSVNVIEPLRTELSFWSHEKKSVEKFALPFSGAP